MHSEGGTSALPKREGCLFSQLEVFEANSASNGAACIVCVKPLFLETARKNTSQCLELGNTFWKVVKIGTFVLVTDVQRFHNIYFVKYCQKMKDQKSSVNMMLILNVR